MVITRKISLQTKGTCDIIDITPQVERQVADVDINNGTATLFVTGSTAGIATIELESGAVADLQSSWQQIVLVDFDNRPWSRQIILQIMGD